MSCNCYGEMKKRVLEHLAKDLPDGATEPDIELDGYTFGIRTGSNDLIHQAAHQAVIRYEEPKKKGGMKKTVKKIQVFATFCPFCGEKY